MAVTADTTAAKLVAEARRRAGISQAELSRRCGLTRSVLSAYEHGRRQPSVGALARIADAAGLELELVPHQEDDSLRAGAILEQVLDLAEMLPSRRRGRLKYPSLRRIAA